VEDGVVEDPQSGRDVMPERTTSIAPSPVDLGAFRRAVGGPVLVPGDPGYDESRTPFYGGYDRHPAAVVRPADAAEVARVVTFAAETGAELAVRSGGHSNAGHSTTEGGIVLDLCAMKALEIDAESRTAWAQTGLTAGEYTTATNQYGLGTGFGDTGSVGIGGITVGGGVGFLARRYGLTIDSLLAAEVVTADGRVRQVDEDSEPDLFWAIRGGGGNFGVATRLRFRMQPVGMVVGGMLLLPATPEVIAGIVAESDAAPEELSVIANVMPAPPMPFVSEEWHGRLIVLAMLVWAGDLADGARAVDRLRALAPPIADLVREMPYPQIYLPEEEGYRPTAIGRTLFLDSVDDATARMIVDRLESSDAAMRVTQLRVLGGAVARVPAAATAYAHRDRRIMANVAAFYTGPEDKAIRQAWVEDFATDLRQGDDAAYVNFLMDEGPERVRAAYPGATWQRLTEVKRRYDPDNLFRLNQNVPPAA
jgi:FAD/FMN-containing dehydrogenase